MSLEYVILGFLAVAPKTGYDLKKRFDRSVAGFWPADQSRIYRTLSRLDEYGLVSHEIIAQSDRPNRKLYHITDEGRADLHQWLTECQPGPSHSAFLVQVFFAGLLGDEKAIQLLEAKAARIREALNSFPKCYPLSQNYEHDEPDQVDFYHFLTLDSAIHMRYAMLEWLEDTIARIRAGESCKGREGAITRWPPYVVPSDD